MSLSVGDKVSIHHYDWGSRRDGHLFEGQVVKVGRRWATVRGLDGRDWPEYHVDKDDGTGKPERGMSPHFRGYTPEQWEEHQERRVLDKRWLELTQSGAWRDRVSNEKLKALIAVLEG